MIGNKKIIAFAGRKRSGKTMFSEGIKKYFGSDNVEIVTIADNLKFLCCDLLDISYNQLIQMKDDGTVFRKKVDEQWVLTINKRTDISLKDINEVIGNITFSNVREVLQIIGTDLIRRFKPNWHIDKTIERIKAIDNNKIIIIDDVRFDNEKNGIELIGGDVFFIIRPNCFDVSNHISEISLTYDKFVPQNVIINDLDKKYIIDNFISYYFSEGNNQFLLSSNPWYIQNVIKDETNIERKTIINQVLKDNMKNPQFLQKGIITFTSHNEYFLNLFRQYFLNSNIIFNNKSAYAIYNPLTNETLKQYM